MKALLLTIPLVGIFGMTSAKDKIEDLTLVDGHKVTLKVTTGGGTETKKFEFPKKISDYKVIPFMPGASVIIVAKPQEAGDWFWGMARLGDGTPETGTVVKWSTSPPHEANLLAVEHPEGDSFVVYAASFKRAIPHDAIRTYAYVNHCALPAGDRDPIGCLYSGEIGGQLKIGPAEPGDGGQPAPRPESK